MTVEQICLSEFINDKTEIFIRDKDMHLIAHGCWYEDKILDYQDRKVESFTWQDDNKVYIDLTVKSWQITEH